MCVKVDLRKSNRIPFRKIENVNATATPTDLDGCKDKNIYILRTYDDTWPHPRVYHSTPGTGAPRTMSANSKGPGRMLAGPPTSLYNSTVAEDLVDPTTRAAMSLPHLPKITTPYGFLTLGESPCVRRRESLFFKDDLTQSCMINGTSTPSSTKDQTPSVRFLNDPWL